MPTYPPAPTTSTEASPRAVHNLLEHPGALARQLAIILERQFIADYLLTGRFVATGGAILYETGQPLTTTAPERIAAGGEYPMEATGDIQLSSAPTSKWGQGTVVTDEAIARLRLNPIDRALNTLAASIVKGTDSIAMGVIASKITQTYDVTDTGNGGAWTTAEAIITSVLRAKALAEAEGLVNYNTIVLSPIQYATVMSLLIAGGTFPREENNPLTTGSFPRFAGLTWVSTPNSPPGGNPLLVDTELLGGIATEDLTSPGYGQTFGIEVQTIRQAETDSWRIHARRVFVPVVLEPRAATFITGHGLS